MHSPSLPRAEACIAAQTRSGLNADRYDTASLSQAYVPQPVELSYHRRKKERRTVNTWIVAEPQPVEIQLNRTALIIIDMQRDFLEPGGFGEALGNDVGRLQAAVKPCQVALRAARAARILVIHTRQGHRPDLSDAPRAKIDRGAPSMRIGDSGPVGRILVRGELGHDFIPALYPAAGEPIVDKSGKGAFYQTDPELTLRNRGVENLLVCGVTTEVCVNTTVRGVNDRGYRCIVLSDCCASYFPEIHVTALKMIKAQGGIFGWVSDSDSVVAALGIRK